VTKFVVLVTKYHRLLLRGNAAAYGDVFVIFGEILLLNVSLYYDGWVDQMMMVEKKKTKKTRTMMEIWNSWCVTVIM
jgi:hypothetical protein